ncbi:MAG: nicotinate-nucleotide adenylyltransferase [Coxiellaceae bacterium]|nr:MAG: nicotinate-nucleotide adenylyltransferase [Coxiellaceae bacterium]
MATLNRKIIGILGGTFDPIHLGHLQLAKTVYTQLLLAEVRLLPCYAPVHRAIPSASAQDRLAMVQIAVQNQPGLSVDDREIRRQGPSYMFDTLQSLRHELGNQPLALIMAADAFESFSRWHRWQEIPELAHLIITNREQEILTSDPNLQTLLRQRQVTNNEDLQTAPAGKIICSHISPLAISATDIRQRIAKGKSAKDMLPAGVWEYICLHQLYR